jgi:oligopeptide transport system substrate-binding protein
MKKITLTPVMTIKKPVYLFACFIIMTTITIDMIQFIHKKQAINSIKKNPLTLHRSLASCPKTLDPHKPMNTLTSYFLSELYATLIRNHNNKIEPGVALSYTISPNGKTYTFNLDPHYKWSNGDPLTAHHFIYAWQRLIAQKKSIYALSHIKNAKSIIDGDKSIHELSVKALSNHCLEIDLEQPSHYFLPCLSAVQFCALHPKSAYLDPCHDDCSAQIFSGAYTIKDSQKKTYVLLQQNKYYTRHKYNAPLHVYCKILNNTNKVLHRFDNNKLDLSFVRYTDKIPKKEKYKKSNQLKHYTGNALLNITVNDKSPKLQNIKIRRALSLAIDKAIMIQHLDIKASIGHNIIKNNYISTKRNNCPKDNIPYEEAVQVAKDLFEQAGITPERPLKLSFLFSKAPKHKWCYNLLCRMWSRTFGKSLYIINPIDHYPESDDLISVFHKKTQQHAYDVVLFSAQSPVPHPSVILQFFTKRSRYNLAHFHNDQFEKILEKASYENTYHKHLHFYQQAEKMLLESYTVIPLMHPKNQWLVSSRLKEFTPDASGHILSQNVIFK